MAKPPATFSPTPSALDVPSDLTIKEITTVTSSVNPLVACSFALYVKYKNFHWHLSGPHFTDYHKLFDKHAAELIETIDTIAERVRRIGGTTIKSIGQIAELQMLHDDEDDFVAADEMVKRLMADNGHLAQMLRDAVEVCDSNRDYGTTNALQAILDETEKRKWFLFEMSQEEAKE